MILIPAFLLLFSVGVPALTGLTRRSSGSAVALLMVVALLEAGCNDKDTARPVETIDIFEQPAGQALSVDTQLWLERVWPQITSVCPGLRRHGDALTFKGIETGFYTNITFSVVAEKSSIPGNYMAAGHKCFFGVTGDESELVIQKEGCKALCLDRVIGDDEALARGDLRLTLDSAKASGNAAVLQRAYDYQDVTEIFEDADLGSLQKSAMRGDYLAQRDLAYELGRDGNSRPVPQNYRPVLACAWRMLILVSGNKKVDDTDIGNAKVACGNSNRLLTPEQYQAAKDGAQTLYALIYKPKSNPHK
jgi:hypothetical protein